jgi:two-component sensor histidine kinase
MAAYGAWVIGTSAVLALMTWFVVRAWERRVSRELAGEREEVSALLASRNAAEAAKRAAEAQRVILLHEVNHRARNALAVAQSLVNLTLADQPELGQEVGARIGALAGAYGLLSENEWQGATMPEIVARALAAFSGPRLGAAGPPIRIAPACVQPLSMLLHELATNASKYGALSGGGQVRIAWRDTGDSIVLTWEETGGPRIAEEPRHAGVGTRVLDAIVGGQLEGSIARHWREAGLLVTVTMAQAALLADPCEEQSATPAAPRSSLPAGHDL